MATQVKTISPEKKCEMELQEEDALKRSLMQYRNLQREVGILISGGELARHEKLAHILTRENVDVVLDLLIACGATKMEGDEKLRTQLVALLMEREQLSKEVLKVKRYSEVLDHDITMKRKLIYEISTKVPSDLQIQERYMCGQKTLDGLENKLDTILKQFGLLTANSRLLREEIDHYLIERINFNKLWYSYLDNLNKGKSMMLDILEQATIAYDQRDEWVVRLQTCRDFAYSEYTMATREMRGLQRGLDNTNKLKEFIGVKQQYRNMKELLERKKAKTLKRRKAMEEDLKRYETILRQIQNFTSIEPKTNTKKFIADYSATETANYAKIVYVEELQRDIDQISEKIIQLQNNIVREKMLQGERLVDQKTKIENLKQHLRTAKKEGDTTQSLLKSTQNTLQKIYNGIEKLFQICKCQNSPLIVLLGDNTTINEFNVLLYLQILEEEVSDLLTNVYHKQKTTVKVKGKTPPPVITEDRSRISSDNFQALVPLNPCPLCVDSEMVSDVIDTLQIVQNKKEVELKLMLRLKLPDGLDRLHNVSACHLPKSRQIIQRRYQ